MITKIQLAGEYWHHEARTYKTMYDLEFIKNGQLNNKDLVRLNEIKYWQVTAEENKPSWLQHPITITIIATVAFVAGLAVGL